MKSEDSWKDLPAALLAAAHNPIEYCSFWNQNRMEQYRAHAGTTKHRKKNALSRTHSQTTLTGSVNKRKIQIIKRKGIYCGKISTKNNRAET